MTPIRKILLAGDAGLRRTLAAEFAATPEFAVAEADDLEAMASQAKANVADLILLSDDFAPDPVQLIESLWTSGFAGQFLLLCSLERQPDSSRFESLRRPFRFADLLVRIRSIFRRESREFKEICSIGPFRFSPRSKELIRGGSNALRLTDIETAILARLAQARGACISRSVLLRDVWGYKPTVTTRTLETHIYRLRQKLERNPARPSLLVTERGGYRLTRGGSTRTANQNERHPLREKQEHGSR
jgi:DNA-binding winged helix-turn-helix (wHTH) protein